MHKAFPIREVLISKGEVSNFLLPQSVSGSTKLNDEMYGGGDDKGWQRDFL